MNNIKKGILLTLVLIGQIAYSMVVEERGKRKFPEIEESAEEQVTKKQKISATSQLHDFFNAIWTGNLQNVKAILNSLSPEKQKELVNYVDANKWALQQAILGMPATDIGRSNYFQIIEELINRGANVNYFGQGKAGFINQPLLLQAIDKEDWELAKFLLSKGANPNITIVSDNTMTTIMNEINNRIDQKIEYIEKQLSNLAYLASLARSGQRVTRLEYSLYGEIANLKPQEYLKMENAGKAKLLELQRIKAELQQ
jgi:ankyrin repeat protein